VPATAFNRHGAGEPLVLLHGFTDTWRAWTPILAALGSHHEVIALSMPGHRGAEGWDASVPFTLESYVDAVERQLDALGLTRAHFVGNSLGGWVSLELAARGRALSVVGVCPAGGWERGGPEEGRIIRFFTRTRRLMRLFRPLLPFVARHPTLRRIVLRDVLVDGRKMPTEEALALFEGSGQCTIFDEVLSLVHTNTGFNPGPIECPVLILYGTADRLLRWPSCFPAMRRALPDAEWVALEGVGHVPMWDDPELVADAIVAHTTAAGGRTALDPPQSA
jgi:pimeloyl-ACP methyl ester carboxylesterase